MLRFLTFVFFVTSMGIFASSARSPWIKKENDFLVSYVTHHHAEKWSRIADALNIAFLKKGEQKRTGKQCRERWHNQLDPGIKKGNWTLEEDELIRRAVNGSYEKRWADISRQVFKGKRSDNDIKNRWYSRLRTRIDPSLIVEKPVQEKPKKPVAVCLKRKTASNDQASDDDSEDEITLEATSSAMGKSGRYPTRVRATPDFFTINHKPKALKRAHSASDSDEAPLSNTQTSTVACVAPSLTPFPPGVHVEFPNEGGPSGGSPFEEHWQGIVGHIVGHPDFPDGDYPHSSDDYDFAGSLGSSPLPTTGPDDLDFF